MMLMEGVLGFGAPTVGGWYGRDASVFRSGSARVPAASQDAVLGGGVGDPACPSTALDRFEMDQSQAAERTVRTIRLDDEKLKKILDVLDASDTDAVAKRKSTRYAYRMKAVLVHMQQPGSTITVPYLVPTRNLSEGGLSFLHGGFVHPGTRCMVQLITTYGTWDDLMGAVVSCRYAEGSIHDVSVRFDREIDPSVYCSAAMHTRVLLVEDDAAMARLTKFLLEALNAEVEIATNGRVAVEKATQMAYDAILMDMELPELDGFEAARQIRQHGYSGLIVATTGLSRAEDAQRCIAAGCNRHVPKPLSRDALSEILQSLREEPLVSTYYNDPSMAEMIDAYVQELPAKVRAVEEAVAKSDAKRVETVTRGLKAEGSSFGFAPISELAAKVEGALIDGKPLAAVQSDITSLVRLCMHARSSSKATHKTPHAVPAQAAPPPAPPAAPAR